MSVAGQAGVLGAAPGARLIREDRLPRAVAGRVVPLALLGSERAVVAFAGDVVAAREGGHGGLAVSTKERVADDGDEVDRTSALLARVTTITTIFGAEAAVEGMEYMDELGVISVQEMHAELAAA